MTTETRTALQWIAAGLLVLFAVASVVIYVYDNITGAEVSPLVVSYLASIMGTITTILGFNSGSHATEAATEKATANTATMIAATNGSGHAVAQALANSLTPSDSPVSQSSGASDATNTASDLSGEP